MIRSRGWGSPSESPILSAIGTSNTAAMVCEMLKVSWYIHRDDSQSGNDESDQREYNEDAIQAKPLNEPFQQSIQIIEQT
jgi:hypothetical protein